MTAKTAPVNSAAVRHAEKPLPTSLRQIFKAAISLLDRATRRSFVLALCASVAVAIVEMVGLVLMVPLLAVLSGGDLPTAGISGRIMRLVGTNDRYRVVIILTCCVFGSFVIRALVTLLVRWWMFGLIFRSEAAVSRALLHRYLSAPYAFHLRTNSAVLVRTLTLSVDQVYSRVLVHMVTIVTESIVAIGIVSVLIAVQPLAALGAIVYFSLTAIVLSRYISPRSISIGSQLQAQNLEVIKRANQAFGAIKHIELGSYQDVFVDHMREVRNKAARTKRLNQTLAEIPRQYFELAFIIGIGLMILLVSTLQGTEAVFTVIGIFAVAGFRLLPGVVRMASAEQTLQTGVAPLALVLEDLDIAAIPADTELIPPEVVAVSAFVLKNVSFAYPSSDQLALKDITLNIQPGESVALVGPSGSGKTTMVDLIMGIHPPTSGQILIGDVPLASALTSWQSQIGLVPQEIYLLDSTIRSNIAFGWAPADIDAARVDHAVQLAQLEDLIAELPEGLDTVVGERGVRLSGGQRQRLGIARALYRRPQVLVLDEATSALDSLTELRITDTLSSLHGELTIITIAHRLSTIRGADRIILMTGGRIVAEGSFVTLQDRSPLFRELVSVS